MPAPHELSPGAYIVFVALMLFSIAALPIGFHHIRLAIRRAAIRRWARRRG